MPDGSRRPVPLNTVHFQKLAARHLRMSSERAMAVAEGLYREGVLSYPRTETNGFSEGCDYLRDLVAKQTPDGRWGSYASGLLEGKYAPPRRGGQDDKAHPPIHPLKAFHGDGERARVYELVTRCFLACVSRDAQGQETSLGVEIAGESFSVAGLQVRERNFLEVYPYERWGEKALPNYDLGETFVPSSLLLHAGTTEPPKLLREDELIGLMDSNGIGTDATIAAHIKTIQDRQYASKTADSRFCPTSLGLALVEAYNHMGFNLEKPHLRAAMEADLTAICQGRKTLDEVCAVNARKYRDIYEKVARKSGLLDRAVRKHIS